jgi:dTDP-4-dehydrorhamnose 3,5-epimerase
MAYVEELKEITGVYVVRLEEHPDERGRFVETWRRRWIPQSNEMVQSNRSDSRAGVLRGLHYHLFQADYWHLVSGRATAGLFDFRSSSATYRATATIELDGIGLYIPPGVAHGFYAHSDCTLSYLVDQEFDGSDEFGIRWDDADAGILWPEGEKILSDRDRSNLLIGQIPPENRPA